MVLITHYCDSICDITETEYIQFTLREQHIKCKQSIEQNQYHDGTVLVTCCIFSCCTMQTSWWKFSSEALNNISNFLCSSRCFHRKTVCLLHNQHLKKYFTRTIVEFFIVFGWGIIAIALEVWKNESGLSLPYTHNTDIASNANPSLTGP